MLKEYFFLFEVKYVLLKTMSWPEKYLSIDQVPAVPLCLWYLSYPEQLSSKTKYEV